MSRASIRIRHIGRLCCVAAAALVCLIANVSLASVEVYDGISSPEPYNLPSLGYQATSTQEFGDRIGLAGTERDLTTVRVGMSSWALRQDYPNLGAAGYNHDLTLNLYNVGSGGSLGSLIISKTINALIPWTPGQPWVAPDGNSYNGLFFTVLFDFTADGITLPNELIAAIAFNTETHGYNPIGSPGPYNSLNVALSSSPDEPTIGTDVVPGETFWNTSFAGFYTDGGAGGVGVLRPDTNWEPYNLAIEVNANGEVPEAASFLVWSVLAMAAGGIGLCRRERSNA